MKAVTSILLIIALGVFFVNEAQASTPIPAAPQDRPVALTGGTIHTVSGGDIANGTVLFVNGKIAAIGTDVELPEGTDQIDVSGRHVYPGLIDANTYLGLQEIGEVRATRDRRETGDINPNARAEVAVNPESELIPVTRSNGVTVALTAPSGGVLSGTSALIYLDGWTWEDMTLKAPVALHMSWPRMRPVTAWWMRQSPEEQTKRRDENLKEIADAFADARAYMIAREAAKGAHRPDSRWEAMIPVLKGEVPVIVNAGDIEQIEAAVAFAEREQIKLIVHGGYDAPQCADLLTRSDIPVIVGGVLHNPRRRGDAYDAPFTVPERLRQAGVRYCISGDEGASNVRNLPYHAAMAAAYGLPHDEALKAITLYPAQILGVADQIGAIEVGMDATLIVTNGDILEIPTHVELEFMRGRRIDLSDKQKLLWLKYQEKYRQLGIGD
jgi:imidazolonepropionase-like amidohydrolase